MAYKTSPHILGTSANLLGFCLFVITFLHFSQKAENTLIDEFTSVVALFLALSSILPFVSIMLMRICFDYNSISNLADTSLSSVRVVTQQCRQYYTKNQQVVILSMVKP